MGSPFDFGIQDVPLWMRSLHNIVVVGSDTALQFEPFALKRALLRNYKINTQV